MPGERAVQKRHGLLGPVVLRQLAAQPSQDGEPAEVGRGGVPVGLVDGSGVHALCSDPRQQVVEQR